MASLRKTFAGLAVAAAAAVMPISASHAQEVEGFVDNMINSQYFLHKAGLSIRAGNFELADFYLHEMEEIIAAVEGIPSYKEQPVGQLIGAMLGPAFHTLEDGVDGKDRDAALTAYGNVISACNACHVATGFGYIKIADNPNNLYLQDFSK